MEENKSFIRKMQEEEPELANKLLNKKTQIVVNTDTFTKQAFIKKLEGLGMATAIQEFIDLFIAGEWQSKVKNYENMRALCNILIDTIDEVLESDVVPNAFKVELAYGFPKHLIETLKADGVL